MRYMGSISIATVLVALLVSPAIADTVPSLVTNADTYVYEYKDSANYGSLSYSTRVSNSLVLSVGPFSISTPRTS